MKKIIIYISIFILTTLGTVSAILLNDHIESSSMIEEPEEESILTTALNSVTNLDFYSGNILFCSKTNNINIEGTFSYINDNKPKAEILLNGKIDDSTPALKIYLINDYTYIDCDNTKFKLETTKILSVLTNVTKFLTNQENNSLNLDISSLSNISNNIKYQETTEGFCIYTKIENICNITLITDKNKIPTRLEATDIKIGKETCNLLVTGSKQLKTINSPNVTEYINLGNAIDYIEPILNTLTLNKLKLSGTINYKNIEINSNIYYNSKTKILTAQFLYQNISATIEIANNEVVLKINSNYFKGTLNEFLSNISNIVPKILNSEQKSINLRTSNIQSALKDINTIIKVNNNKISQICYSNSDITIDFNIGETLTTPPRLQYKEYKPLNNLFSLLNNVESFICNKYSMFVMLNTPRLKLSGNAYIELKEKSIKTICFDGNINNENLLVVHDNEVTYISYNDIKIKIKNASIKSILNEIQTLTKIELPKIDYNTISEINLDNLLLFSNKIQFSTGVFDASISKLGSKYKFIYNEKETFVSAEISPNISRNKSILTKIIKEEYISLDNSAKILQALNNTIKNKIQYEGKSIIAIKGLTIKEIDINLQIKKDGLVITLSNLPCDIVSTNQNDLFFKNHRSQITLNKNSISILSTVDYRFYDSTLILCDKTINYNDVSNQTISDILGIRTAYISNVSTSKFDIDLRTILKTLAFSITNNNITISNFNEIFENMSISLDFDKYIDKLNLGFSLNSDINIKILLKRS